MTDIDNEISRSMVTTSVSINTDQRGNNLSPENKRLVTRLIAQAKELQRRFNLAEKTAIILEQTLDPASGLNDAVSQTYEGHAFETIRMQLFRALIVDLYAAVFDGDTRTGSVRSILKELRRDTNALNALREYYSDTECLDIEVIGKQVDAQEIKYQTDRAKTRHRDEATTSFNNLWKKIDTGSTILNTDQAKRIKWARVQVVAHFEKTEDGLVPLDAEPTVGGGTLKWGEPINLLREIHEYVYDVFLLITRTHWGNDFTTINKFYAETFWDRFKNGHTELQPPKL